jgi:hypothetical protein
VARLKREYKGWAGAERPRLQPVHVARMRQELLAILGNHLADSLARTDDRICKLLTRLFTRKARTPSRGKKCKIFCN